MSFSALCAHSLAILLFFSENVFFLAGIIVEDAEYTSIVITVGCSVIATAKVDCVDVDIIGIDIELSACAMIRDEQEPKRLLLERVPLPLT